MPIKNVLLISFGGSLEPVRFSIETNKPTHIIFFCSAETYASVHELSECLTGIEYERIVSENHEDITENFLILSRKIQEKLNQWNKTWKDVIVDYTSGSKPMSAALVLATIKSCNSFCYIGGTNRTKYGKGTVVTGSERPDYHQNPWNTYAYDELPEIDLLFDRARYETASERIGQIADRVDANRKPLYDAIKKAVDGYHKWDTFEHKKAIQQIKEAYTILAPLVVLNNPPLTNLIKTLDEHYIVLSSLSSAVRKEKLELDAYPAFCRDITANAMRRADKECMYDDAVARLYCVIERYLKGELLKYNIDNSDAQKEDIPNHLHGRFEVGSWKNNKGQFGLYKSAELLSCLDNSFMKKYKKYELEIKKLMYKRNFSILGHGINPISKEDYEKMLELVLEFLEIKRDELVQFPSLSLSQWIPRL